MVDASDLRRGLATANAVWGNKPSVLVGDFLFSRAFQLMVEDGSLEVLDILSHASAVIAEGEVLQLVTSNDIDTTEADYLRVINAKTAQLFAAASRIGAVLGERSEAEEQRARGLWPQSRHRLPAGRRHARLLGARGRARQDRSATISARARSPCRSCWRCAPADERERQFWRRTLEELEQREGDLERAIELLRRHGTLAATWSARRDYAAEARARAGRLPRRPGAAGARRG